MAAEKKTALAVMEGFAIADRYEGLDPELLAELQDELADLDPEDGILYRQIKVPGGGGPAFEVQGETEDDVEPMKAIEGVIVFTHRVNAYWPGTYGEGDGSKAPACSSMDGKTGLNADTGEVCNCDICPYNQYGTGIDDKGRQVKGKACKNMRRVYLLMSGDPNLYLLTVPPTSIRPVNRQLAKILSGGTPYVGMVMRFTLERVKNSGGIVYSKVQVQTAGRLPAAAIAQIRQMRAEIKKQHQSMAITLDDYEPAHAKGQPVDVNPDDAEMDSLYGDADFEEAPPHDDADLPFR